MKTLCGFRYARRRERKLSDGKRETFFIPHCCAPRASRVTFSPKEKYPTNGQKATYLHFACLMRVLYGDEAQNYTATFHFLLAMTATAFENSS
jgi:hypothetical protein